MKVHHLSPRSFTVGIDAYSTREVEDGASVTTAYRKLRHSR